VTDDAPTLLQRWPYSAAATFVGLMWIAYGWAIWVAGGMNPAIGGMWIGSLTGTGYYVAGALDSVAVVQDGEWERLISCIFLHAGFLHIIMNSAAILQLGRILEMFTTRERCWFTLLFSGLAGSLTTLAWAELTGSSGRSVGASGAGCGLGAALIVLSRGLPALDEFRKQMITWVLVMLALGLVPMISGTGHLGGAAGGAAAGLIIARRGSMRVRADRYGKALDLLALALTLVFVAALVLTAWRAPERKSQVAQFDALIEDMYVWLDGGALPPDVRDWIARARALDLPSDLARRRAYLVDLTEWLQARGGGKISPQDADEVREDLLMVR
jgi:membrane associated rhomboid family serine protease